MSRTFKWIYNPLSVVHLTVLIFLILLLTSIPFYTGQMDLSNYTGDSQFVIDNYYNPQPVHPLAIIILGPFSIFFGIVSFYWFAVYFALSYFQLQKPLYQHKLYKIVALILLFTICAFQLYYLGSIGRSALSDITQQKTYIIGHGAGYYIYLLLIIYLIFATIILSIPKIKNITSITLLSSLSLLMVAISIYIYSNGDSLPPLT